MRWRHCFLRIRHGVSPCRLAVETASSTLCTTPEHALQNAQHSQLCHDRSRVLWRPWRSCMACYCRPRWVRAAAQAMLVS